MRALVLVLLTACATTEATAPVISNPLQRPENPTVDRAAANQPGALVLVIDRSGSMQGAKLEAAKLAARAALDALDATDRIAIVMFDSEATVLVPLQSAANHTEIEAGIDRATSGGGTHMLPGLRAADDLLRGANETIKHVILLSDGEAPTEGLVELARDMRARKISISTVAVEGADTQLLDMLRDAGGGRLYKVDDLAGLSQVFTRETKIAMQ